MKEQIMERLFPIRISANPGRDCKEFELNSPKKGPLTSSSTQDGLQGLISSTAILSAIDDEAFINNLTDEEKAEFCRGLILYQIISPAF